MDLSLSNSTPTNATKDSSPSIRCLSSLACLTSVCSDCLPSCSLWHRCCSLAVTLSSCWCNLSLTADVNAWVICHPSSSDTHPFLFLFHSFPPPFLPAHTYTNAHNTYDYTQSGETALHDAVNQGHEDVVDILLEANIDPDVADKVSHMTLTSTKHEVYISSTAHCTEHVPHWLITMLFMMKFVQLDGYVYALGSILNCTSWLVHQISSM